MDPTLLMATIGDEDLAEAEPVLVQREPDNVVLLALDDGQHIRFDRDELAAAIGDAHKQAA